MMSVPNVYSNVMLKLWRDWIYYYYVSLYVLHNYATVRGNHSARLSSTRQFAETFRRWSEIRRHHLRTSGMNGQGRKNKTHDVLMYKLTQCSGMMRK